MVSESGEVAPSGASCLGAATASPFAPCWPAAVRSPHQERKGQCAATGSTGRRGTVKQGDFNVYITGLGSVQALNTVSLKTRIDGQIMQVNFREGQDVKAGELLIVIDPRPYQVALAQAEANLQKDEAQLTNAKAQYERNKVLYEQGVIAKQDLDTLEASFGTYEGTIAADKAAIDNAKLNLTYCYIKSPVPGQSWIAPG